MGMATVRREIASLDNLSRGRELTEQESWRLQKLLKVERRYGPLKSPTARPTTIFPTQEAARA